MRIQPSPNTLLFIYNQFSVQIQASMELSYAELAQTISARDKHIVELESELLRLDYEYGQIIADLKKKQQLLEKKYQRMYLCAKHAKQENKKLAQVITAVSKQNQQAKDSMETGQMKISFHEESIKRIKEENDNLRGEIRYLEANQNKYIVKTQQATRKKEYYQQQCVRMQQKINALEKQVKISHQKRKKLQQLVQQEVEQTKQRVHNMGLELTKARFQQDLKMTISNNQPAWVESVQVNNPEAVMNDWESDMKKLKNCVDYGSSYILVFDPMNLDRVLSREVFKFLKKCLKQVDQVRCQLTQKQAVEHQLINKHKQMLQYFEAQIAKISQTSAKKVAISTQMQTQPTSSNDMQKAVMHLSDLNTKLKIKNVTLVECLDILALRSVALHSMLQNAHIINRYNKKSSLDGRKPSRNKKLSLRCAFLAVYFVQLSRKKAKQSSPFRSSLPPCRKTYNAKLRLQTTKLQKMSVHNIELEKLRDRVLIEGSHIYESAEEVVNYYQFKFQNYLEAAQVASG